MAAPKKSTASVSKAKSPTQPASLDDYIEEVKKRSYEIFLGRGGQPGAEISDWVQAEKEIKAKYSIK
jgi:hypothetical protein